MKHLKALTRAITARPLLTVFVVTLIMCVIYSPGAVGAWYGNTARAIVAGVIAFVKGAV